MPTLVKTVAETVAEFNTALRSATGGETILLKGGVNFGQLKLYRPATPYLSEVVVRSEDPSDKATLHSVVLDRANNLTIRDVDFVNEDRFATITMGNSHGIKIDNCSVTANHDPYVVPVSFITGISVRGYCTDVTISNNLFTRLGSVLSIGQTDGIQITGNTFRENQLDSINCSSDVCNILIRGNMFYAQLQANKPGHHYDAIQFWVHPQATKNSKGITIEDNNIFDFSGTVSPQSIFMRANYNDANGNLIPFMFEDVVIRNNLLIAQHSNAIAVSRSAGLRIHNNTLIYGGDRFGNPSAVNIPTIGQSMSTDAHVYNNIMPKKNGQPAVDTEEYYDNIVYNLNDGELARFLLNPYAPTVSRANFATMPIPEAIGKGISSVPAGGPVALFDYYVRAEEGYLYTFDGSLTVPNADHTYVWSFADGTSLEGRVVARTFTQSGVQDVTLTVTDSQGRSDTFTKHLITILDPSILDYDFDAGVVDNSAFPSDLRQTKELVTVPDSESGLAVIIGGNNGHLYLPPSDPDWQQIANTKQLTVAMDFKAVKEDNTANMILGASHGKWNLAIIPSTGIIQFALAGRFHRFNPGVDLLNDSWYRLAVSFTNTSMRFFVDETQVGEVTPPPGNMERVFEPSTYGLSIGGTGPWLSAAATTKFVIDNLHVSSLSIA